MQLSYNPRIKLKYTSSNAVHYINKNNCTIKIIIIDEPRKYDHLEKPLDDQYAFNTTFVTKRMNKSSLTIGWILKEPH